jgi:hypothetical protein
MTYTNPQTAAAYADITARAATALRSYLTAPRGEEVEALASYDAAMGKIDEAFDALLDVDCEGVTALLIAS